MAQSSSSSIVKGGGKRRVVVKDNAGQDIHIKHYGQPGLGPAFHVSRLLIPQGYSMERRVLGFVVQGQTNELPSSDGPVPGFELKVRRVLRRERSAGSVLGGAASVAGESIVAGSVAGTSIAGGGFAGRTLAYSDRILGQFGPKDSHEEPADADWVWSQAISCIHAAVMQSEGDGASVGGTPLQVGAGGSPGGSLVDRIMAQR